MGLLNIFLGRRRKNKKNTSFSCQTLYGFNRPNSMACASSTLGSSIKKPTAGVGQGRSPCSQPPGTVTTILLLRHIIFVFYSSVDVTCCTVEGAKTRNCWTSACLRSQRFIHWLPPPSGYHPHVCRTIRMPFIICACTSCTYTASC